MSWQQSMHIIVYIFFNFSRPIKQFQLEFLFRGLFLFRKCLDALYLTCHTVEHVGHLSGDCGRNQKAGECAALTVR